MNEFLFEIGVEEIPSDYIRPAQEALGQALAAKLAELGLPFEKVTTYATPRRLAVCVTGLPRLRPTKTKKHFGPPKKAAFAPDGSPTKAAKGFAMGKGADVSQLKVETTPKGEYIYLEIEEGGEKTADLLARETPPMALGLPFPKSMKWGDGDIAFTRPIHWVVALFAGEVVPMEVGYVTSGNTTRGHRFLGKGEITVTSCADYLSGLKENFVIARVDERKKEVIDNARRVAKDNGAKLLEDDNLAETVAFLTEWPIALWGSFDEEFLSLPEELLIASMKNHQRMFSVTTADGRLANGFIGVSNMKVIDESVVVAGYQRVLRARLSDAKFFFDEDRKHKLDDFAAKLSGVVYQKKLGSVGDKVVRIVGLAEFLAGEIDPALVDKAKRAAQLCKADLESLMVYEFPELQGVMGREYAKREGEPHDVCAAIYESYLPRWSGDDLPSSDLSAIVSLADKIDTITGIFGIGQTPTGGADPFALRRQTIGVIQILLARGYPLSLASVIDFSIGQLGDRIDTKETKGKILEFFAGRLKNIWASNDITYDVAEAVLSAGFDNLADADKRVLAMSQLKKQKFFEPLAVTFKRVANITKDHTPGKVDEKLFTADIETRLHKETRNTANEVTPLIERKRYLEALEVIAKLRPAVDQFFNDVLVMDEDMGIRENRLNLLSAISGLFLKIADFSRIVVEDSR
ncbi:Glycyl-tRNA synthetase beta chain [hydrothermal vent metagenome]|uniref:glycine--tRNA ligase n=1 Tax=hydrothermal vent metagenome TaxID=652676 RepID=A0A3B1CNC7_9ZZZZ